MQDIDMVNKYAGEVEEEMCKGGGLCTKDEAKPLFSLIGDLTARIKVGVFLVS